MKKLGLFVAALAACGPIEEPVARVEQPIIGGTAAPDLTSVVMIAWYPADHSLISTCSAAVIAPDVLLTAAHCVDPQKDEDGGTYGVFIGPDATAYSTANTLAPHLLPVRAQHVHPAYQRSPPFNADIAVVVLESPLSVAPFQIAVQPVDAGTPARIAGYGQQHYGTFAAQREVASTAISGVDDDTYLVGDLQQRSCVGDSGGPALVMIGGVELVVGVDSYSALSGCLDAAHYRRTDVYVDFIAQYAPGAVPSPADAGRPTDGGTSPPPPMPHGCASVPGGGLAALLLLRRRTAEARRHRRSSRREGHPNP